MKGTKTLAALAMLCIATVVCLFVSKDAEARIFSRRANVVVAVNQPSHVQQVVVQQQRVQVQKVQKVQQVVVQPVQQVQVQHVQRVRQQVVVQPQRVYQQRVVVRQQPLVTSQQVYVPAQSQVIVQEQSSCSSFFSGH